MKEQAKQPNFIIIYADDLGFGDPLAMVHLSYRRRISIKWRPKAFAIPIATPPRPPAPHPATVSPLVLILAQQNAKILPGDAPMIIGKGERTLPGTLRTQAIGQP